MSAGKLTWHQVMYWRVQRHRLDERASRNEVLEVVGDICCLHAQLMSSAELSLWARVDGVSQQDVERMLWTDRTLVKTWAMRGTLHLLPSHEYQLWQAALSLRDHHLKPAWLRAFGVTRDDLERLVQAVGEALTEDPLTREQLAMKVGKITHSPKLGDKLRESWGAMLKPASFRGHLCFGPNKGRKVRFTRPDRWLDLEGGSQPDPFAAQVAITRRWLAAYGPATREDYARWWGITPATGGRLIAALGDAVARVEVEDQAAWMLTEQVAEAAAASPCAYCRPSIPTSSVRPSTPPSS